MSDDKEVVAALISLAGVIISVVIAYIASARQTNIEIRKLRREILQEFNVRLFDKRFDAYTELYTYLSAFTKVLQFGGQITKTAICELYDQVQKWDTKHALLFSARTGIINYEFRVMLYQLSQKSEQELAIEYSAEDALYQLRQKIGQFELALKDELGIYTFESPTALGPQQRFDAYSDIAKLVTEKDSRQKKKSKARPELITD